MKEAAKVLRLIAKVREQGVGIVFITHNARHAMSVGDRFTVLMHGSVAATFKRGEKTREEVLDLMAGGDAADDDLDLDGVEMSEPIVQTAAGKIRGRWIEKIDLSRCVFRRAAGRYTLVIGAAVGRALAWRARCAGFSVLPLHRPVRPSTIIPEPLKAGDDYLNLNIFTPDIGSTRLPVMVWIHGGGYFGGCNQAPWFDGKRFARDGVVVVAPNYRLGFEGFMPVQGAPLNRGVLDWLAGIGTGCTTTLRPSAAIRPM